jgi:LacI family transcriptional regulator
MTGGIYDYLEENDIIVGKDISVAGFDNESISAYFRPQLTTTELPLSEIGRLSAQLILEKIEDNKGSEDLPAEPKVIKVPCSMVIRNSINEKRS